MAKSKYVLGKDIDLDKDVIRDSTGKRISKPLCDAFYETSTTLSHRKAAFGYGKKSDFTSGKMKTPAPSAYNIKA